MACKIYEAFNLNMINILYIASGRFIELYTETITF